MKSVKVFRLLSSFPSSYQARPISSPPRTWAIATTNPAVEQAQRLEENAGSKL